MLTSKVRLWRFGSFLAIGSVDAKSARATPHRVLRSAYEKELRSARAVVIPHITMEATMARGALLWLLGVPIPIIILLFLFWH
jgi:hypothetical protein